MTIENFKWRKAVKIVAYVDLALAAVGVLILGHYAQETNEAQEEFNPEVTTESGLTLDNVMSISNTVAGSLPGRKSEGSNVQGNSDSKDKSQSPGSKNDGQKSSEKFGEKSHGKHDGNKEGVGEQQEEEDGELPDFDFETLKSLMSQAIEIFSLILHFWVAIRLIRATKKDASVNSALEKATLWKNVHLLSLICYVLAFVGIFIQRIPLQLYSAVFILSITELALLYVVRLYIQELSIQADKRDSIWTKLEARLIKLKNRFSRPNLSLQDVGKLQVAESQLLEMHTVIIDEV